MNIVWSDIAEDSFFEILLFIADLWGDEVAIKFNNRVNELLNQITLNPKMFQALQTKSYLRKCVVNKQVSFLYEVKDNHILITLFLDNRADHQYS